MASRDTQGARPPQTASTANPLHQRERAGQGLPVAPPPGAVHPALRRDLGLGIDFGGISDVVPERQQSPAAQTNHAQPGPLEQAQSTSASTSNGKLEDRAATTKRHSKRDRMEEGTRTQKFNSFARAIKSGGSELLEFLSREERGSKGSDGQSSSPKGSQNEALRASRLGLLRDAAARLSRRLKVEHERAEQERLKREIVERNSMWRETVQRPASVQTVYRISEELPASACR